MKALIFLFLESVVVAYAEYRTLGYCCCYGYPMFTLIIFMDLYPPNMNMPNHLSLLIFIPLLSPLYESTHRPPYVSLKPSLVYLPCFHPVYSYSGDPYTPFTIFSEICLLVGGPPSTQLFVFSPLPWFSPLWWWGLVCGVGTTFFCSFSTSMFVCPIYILPHPDISFLSSSRLYNLPSGSSIDRDLFV